MSKPPARDSWLMYAIGMALLLLATGFALTWLYLQYSARRSNEVSYHALPAVAVSRGGHSMSATVAIRTSAADAGWAAANKQALQQVTRRVLMEADPLRTQGPGGLQALQERLRDASNAMLQTTAVREVLLTDFLLSEGDS